MRHEGRCRGPLLGGLLTRVSVEIEKNSLEFEAGIPQP